MGPPRIAPRPQLVTYPDSLGGDLPALVGLLEGPLAGLFRGVHVLPPFPSSGDRGFATRVILGLQVESPFKADGGKEELP